MPRKKEHILDYIDFATFKILRALGSGDKTFTELNKITPLSTPNFNKRLGELLEVSLIKEVLGSPKNSSRKRKVYTLTDTGRRILELLEEIERVYKEGWEEDRELKEMERDLKNQS
jgi:DNA-binding HxlR family transcriptional regulator